MDLDFDKRHIGSRGGEGSRQDDVWKDIYHDYEKVVEIGKDQDLQGLINKLHSVGALTVGQFMFGLSWYT